jgi:hypothetical protein
MGDGHRAWKWDWPSHPGSAATDGAAPGVRRRGCACAHIRRGALTGTADVFASARVRFRTTCGRAVVPGPTSRDIASP